MKKFQSLNEELFKDDAVNPDHASSIIGGGAPTITKGKTINCDTHTGQPANDCDSKEDSIND